MATINLGRIKPVFRGAYSGATAYVIDDIVTSGDETFICILASTGNATSNATYWTKLAAKGTDGTDVGTTITTQGDILYRDGSGLARLAKGTARQGLQTNSGATAPEWVDTPQSLMTAQGDILYASSANTPAKLAKPASDMYLKNTSAGTPSWAAVSSDFVRIGSDTFSDVATVDLGQTLTGYKTHKLYVECFKHTSAGTQLYITAYAGSWLGGSDYEWMLGGGYSSNTNWDMRRNQDEAFMRLTRDGMTDGTSGNIMFSDITFRNLNSSTTRKNMLFHTSTANHDSVSRIHFTTGTGLIKTTTAVTDIRLAASSDNLSGAWELYGIKNA